MKIKDNMPEESSFDKEIKVKVGNRIKIERERKGYTQEYMANRLNTSESHYSNIETGKRNCTINKLVRICKALNITADDILQDYISTDFLTEEKKINQYYERMSSEQRRCLVAIASAYCENIKVMDSEDKGKAYECL